MNFVIKVSKKSVTQTTVALFTVNAYMQHSMLFRSEFWYQLGNLVGVAMVFLCFFYMKIGLKTAILYLAAGSLLLYTSAVTKNYSYFVIYLILLIAKNITVTDYIKVIFRCQGAFLSFHIAAWVLNLLGGGRSVYYGVTGKRLSFFLTHPNIFSLMAVWFLIMYVWLYWNKINIFRSIAVAAATIAVYLSAKSEAVIIMIPVMGMYYFRERESIKKMVIRISKYSFIVSGFVSFLAANLYQGYGQISRGIQIIDVFASSRIAMSSLAVWREGVTWFGKIVDYHNDWSAMYRFNGYTIDNLYILFFTSIGIAYFLLIAYGLYQVGESGNYKAAVMVIAFSLYALVEVHVLYVFNCFVLILLKYWIFKERRIV